MLGMNSFAPYGAQQPRCRMAKLLCWKSSVAWVMASRSSSKVYFFVRLHVLFVKTVTSGRKILVYGDDIIAPSARYEDIIAALRFCGFTPNVRKTYGTGSFRESCGGDYFNGEAVRPYYLKEFDHEPQDYISLANGLRRMAFTSHNHVDRWNRIRRSWFSCLDNLPSNVRSCRGPQDLGDAVIHDSQERWSIKTLDSIRYVRAYLPVSGLEVRWEGFSYDVQFAAALYLAGKGIEKSTRLPNGNLTPRDPVTGYKVGWIAYS